VLVPVVAVDPKKGSASSDRGRRARQNAPQLHEVLLDLPVEVLKSMKSVRVRAVRLYEVCMMSMRGELMRLGRGTNLVEVDSVSGGLSLQYISSVFC
jgi:hypothetical protein